MRKLAAALLAVMVSLALVAAAALMGLYRASQQIPPFYQRALAGSQAPHEASERFERQALALHNQAHHAGQWECQFSEDDINAWLATVLPEKFPQALASGISEPRIAIEDDLLRLAVRYERGGAHTVVSLAARIELTNEPNEIAVQMRELRAGALPVPLARFKDDISARAAQAGVPLRWTEADGHPVALVRLALDAQAATERRVVLERLEVAAAELVVGGRTEEPGPSELVAENFGDTIQTDGPVSIPTSEMRQR